MSTRTDQNADSVSQKGKFMAEAMKSIQAAAEQEDDADQTILQADVLRATAELAKHVVSHFHCSSTSLAHSVSDAAVPEGTSSEISD
jgi:hypothetical protein